jgi:hypothetical protein
MELRGENWRGRDHGTIIVRAVLWLSLFLP